METDCFPFFSSVFREVDKANFSCAGWDLCLNTVLVIVPRPRKVSKLMDELLFPLPVFIFSILL